MAENVKKNIVISKTQIVARSSCLRNEKKDMIFFNNYFIVRIVAFVTGTYRRSGSRAAACCYFTLLVPGFKFLSFAYFKPEF